MEKKFYILRSSFSTSLSTTSHNKYNGNSQIIDYTYGYPSRFYIGADDRPENQEPVLIIPSSVQYSNYEVVMFDKNNNYLGYRVDTYNYSQGKHILRLIAGTYSVYVNINMSPDYMMIDRIWFYIGYEVEPHYKKITLKNKKENGQMFFRESIDGSVKLFGIDYRYVKNASLEQNLMLAICDNSGEVISKNIFNKTECKFDRVKCSVQPKLSPEDRYTNILNRYDDTYDLIKLAPRITPLTLTKRMAFQLYIAGANNMTVVEASGTYYEDDVNTPVDNDEKLRNIYHFAAIDFRREIHLEGFNYDINGTYIISSNSSTWVNTAGEYPGSFIRFDKEYSIGEVYNNTVRRISNGRALDAAELDDEVFENGRLKVDLYSIGIYTGLPDESTGTPTKIYETQDLFFKDAGNFFINGTDDRGFYQFWAISQPIPYAAPIPSPYFILDDNIIDYGIYCRIVCDKSSVTYGGTTYNLYDLSDDDFAYNRANYKKCIGANPSLTISQITATSSKPTRYGRDDYGNYFDITEFGFTFTVKPVPVSRSSWANTSIWAVFDYSFFSVVEAFSQEYTLKDAYNLADVISILLKEIDPNITHENSTNYSQFLYGATSPLSIDNLRNNCNIYIAPKSNILKGNYDQAAQKAEITFKHLMEMLRDCFRCYWFIDNQNQLRIEHISYFLNGMSYTSASVQLDLTSELDKFNKKPALYCQQEIEFDKTELAARYEFAWADDCTDVFGNNHIDVISQYIQQNKVEDITSSEFSSDVDFMICAPDKFSSDGFALLIANTNNHKVPIIEHTGLWDGDVIYTAKPQNYLASWLYLIRYYMYDMPANNIKYDAQMQTSVLAPRGIKKCMKHSIEFPVNQVSIDSMNGLIRTEVGDGYIEEMSTNIDTNMTELELRYAPE